MGNFDLKIFQTFDSMEVPDNFTDAMIDLDAKESEAVAEDKENSLPQNEAANQPQSEVEKKKPMRFMLSGVVDEEKSRWDKIHANLGYWVNVLSVLLVIRCLSQTLGGLVAFR